MQSQPSKRSTHFDVVSPAFFLDDIIGIELLYVLKNVRDA